MTVASTGATSWTTTTTPKTAAITWSAGDVVVVAGTAANNTHTLQAPTCPGLTFTLRQQAGLMGQGSDTSSFAIAWVSDPAAAGGSDSISMARTAGTGGQDWGFRWWVIGGSPYGYAGGWANENEAATSYYTPSGADVLYLHSDWNAAAAGRTAATGSGTATERDDLLALSYTVYTADWEGTTASTGSFGTTTYSLANVQQVGIVIAPSGYTPPAFPVPETVAETAVSTAGTNHAWTLPAGIQATDMVLIVYNLGTGTNPSVNALTDWTHVLDETVVNGIGAVVYTGAGVPSNPTFTTNVSTRSAAIAFRISNADKTITPQVGTTAALTNNAPNPPSVTPTGGTVKDYLFIAFFGAAGEEADDDTWLNTPPANYLPSPPYQKAAGTAGTNLGGLVGAAYRQLTTGAAEDPGTFNMDASLAWRANTIIVHPPPAGVTLVVQEATHGHTADSPTLTQIHGLAAQDATNAHAADNVALTQAHSIAVQDATHGHAADNVVLTVATPLVVQDATHGHAADSPSLTQAHSLGVQDATHALPTESPTLTQGHVLVVQDATHGHSVDSPTLSQSHLAAAQDATNAHTADNVVLTQGHILAVQEATHGHTADSPSPTQAHALSAQDATHGHTADSPTLTQAHTLAAQDATHANLAESPSLSGAGSLGIQEAAHAHSADSPTLTQAHNLTVQDATHGHAADSPTLVLPMQLVVQDATHGHTADSPALVQSHTLVVQEALHGHTADTVPMAGLAVGLFTCAVSGPATKPTALAGPVVEVITLDGPTLVRQISGPVLEVVSAGGPALATTLSLDGPAVSRDLTGPAKEAQPIVSSGPDTALEVAGPAICAGG